jgi:serine/threonine protein kinase
MLLTQSGAKLGTAPYMAPEQIEQPSRVDHRADIYSHGVVCYEMLTGDIGLDLISFTPDAFPKP